MLSVEERSDYKSMPYLLADWPLFMNGMGINTARIHYYCPPLGEIDKCCFCFLWGYTPHITVWISTEAKAKGRSNKTHTVDWSCP